MQLLNETHDFAAGLKDVEAYRAWEKQQHALLEADLREQEEQDIARAQAELQREQDRADEEAIAAAEAQEAKERAKEEEEEAAAASTTAAAAGKEKEKKTKKKKRVVWGSSTYQAPVLSREELRALGAKLRARDDEKRDLKRTPEQMMRAEDYETHKRRLENIITVRSGVCCEPPRVSPFLPSFFFSRALLLWDCRNRFLFYYSLRLRFVALFTFFSTAWGFR